MPNAKLFGTDGIRGTPGRSPLTGQEITRIGQCFGTFLGKGKRALVCRDTRKSGLVMQHAITSGFASSGIDVHDMGILSTPAAAFLVRHLEMDAAAVISASHNPAEENGIKFFTAEGRKLSAENESKIEVLFNSGRSLMQKSVGNASKNSAASAEYVKFAKGIADAKGIRLVVDCANGAAYRTAPQILEKAGAETIAIGIKPNGININTGCGSEHPEQLEEAVVRKNADMGIALDGDADRVLLVDEKGKALSGDQIIGIAAISMAKAGNLAKNKIIATHYSNYGLEESLNRYGIGVIRSEVGDRAVADAMLLHSLNLGGEQSGHIIFADTLPTGDGIITALKIISAMKEEGKRLSELAAKIKMSPQVIINVKVSVKAPIEQLKLYKSIKEAQDVLEGAGRLYVRYSGTQSLLRIMVEGKNEKQINKIAQELAKQAEKELG